MRRVLPPLLGTLLTASVLGTVAAAPALAHTRLVSSTPTADVPAQAPREISLDFTDPVQPGLSTVSVTGADGRQRAAGTPTAGEDDASVTQALAGPLDPGTYRVAYRVLAADGHPVTGSFEVTVLAAPTPTATPASSPLATASPPLEDTASPSLRPAAGERDEDGGLPVLTLVVGGLVVAGGAGVLARRLGGDLPRT